MPLSQQELAALAGVDPWTLRQKLTSGNPAAISGVAASFASAGKDGNLANQLHGQAAGLAKQGYTVDGAGQADASGAVKQASAKLGNDSTKLVTIARGLDAIADSLATNTASASATVTTLSATLKPLVARYNQLEQQAAAQSKAQSPAGQDLAQQAAAEKARVLQQAVAATRTAGGQVRANVSAYEAAVAGQSKTLAGLGFTPPNPFYDPKIGQQGAENVKRAFNFLQWLASRTDHAAKQVGDSAAKTSGEIGLAGFALDQTGWGAPLGAVLGAISTGYSAMALAGHGWAMFGGNKEVTGQQIGSDALGVASFGIGKALDKGVPEGVIPDSIDKGAPAARYGHVASTGAMYNGEKSSWVPQNPLAGGIAGTSLIAPICYTLVPAANAVGDPQLMDKDIAENAAS